MNHPDTQIDIREHGALADGRTVCTRALQGAVDACAAGGGGVVRVPPGRFVTGTVELKSHVHLRLEPGAELLGSPDSADYRKLHEGDRILTGIWDSPFNRDQHLVVARGARDTGILGPGTIDARGEAFYHTDRNRATGKNKDGGVEYVLRDWRPGPTVAFFDCEDVRLHGFKLVDNPMYAVLLRHSRHVTVRDVRILTNHRFCNGDGLHVSGCEHVTVTGCRIDAEDDALCFFTGPGRKTDCRWITVSDCVLSSTCSGVRIGYCGSGRLEDIVVSNVVITRAKHAVDFICQARNDYVGGEPGAPTIRDISFCNVRARDSHFGITANVQPDARPPGGIEGLRFAHLDIRSRYGCYLCGHAGLPLRDVSFVHSHLHITGPPSSDAALPETVPVFNAEPLPYALVLRDTQDVRFDNSRLSFAADAVSRTRSVHAERCVNLRSDGLECEAADVLSDYTTVTEPPA
jgi:hypothetical protein